jgi:hypothetical protein
MTVTDTPLTTRNATIADLSALLEAKQAAKLDAVAPARDLVVAPTTSTK